MQDPRTYYPLCIKPLEGDACPCNLLLGLLMYLGIPAESLVDCLRPVPG